MKRTGWHAMRRRWSLAWPQPRSRQRRNPRRLTHDPSTYLSPAQTPPTGLPFRTTCRFCGGSDATWFVAAWCCMGCGRVNWAIDPQEDAP